MPLNVNECGIFFSSSVDTWQRGWFIGALSRKIIGCNLKCAVRAPRSTRLQSHSRLNDTTEAETCTVVYSAVASTTLI